jgi:hypothetical protein
MFADWLKFSFIEELTYENDVLLQDKISDQLCAGLVLKLRLLGHIMFGWVIVSRQLLFHIYYLFVTTNVIVMFTPFFI